VSGFFACLGLFLSAFVAATILPAQSETVLTGLILLDQVPVGVLVVVASLGNVAGSVLNWGLGRAIERYRDRQWFPVKPAMLARATGWYHRYGRWSLLLSWVPVIGDPLTLVAGVLREEFWRFLLLVGIAKTGRYICLALLVMYWSGG
jgi:membrane protein YqaA with SNARE-associated domain